MNDEDLLRSALSTMTLDQPPPGDRVGEVRVRIRRRAWQRAVVTGTAVLLVALGAAALVALPGEGTGRESLPAGPPPTVEQREDVYRIPITQLVVRLPGVRFEDALQQVEATLSPLAPPDRIGRKLTETAGPDEDAVRVDFERTVDPTERARLQAAFAALEGAQIALADIDGFDLALAAPLSTSVLKRLRAAGQTVPKIENEALATALGGVYGGDTSSDGRILRVLYTGPALTDEQLATARREVARVAGVTPDEVRLLRGADRDRDPGPGSN